MSTSDEKQTEAENQLYDVSDEYAKMAVEALASDEVLSHIPVIKTVRGVAKVVISVRDTILLRKLQNYLYGFSRVSAEERREMIARLRSEPDYGDRIGERIIELLDRVESDRKPSMIAAAFAAFANKEIDLKTLRRLNGAIERLPTNEIPTARQIGDKPYFLNLSSPDQQQGNIDSESLQALANAGMILAVPVFDGISFFPNETAKTFVRLNLDRCQQRDQ